MAPDEGAAFGQKGRIVFGEETDVCESPCPGCGHYYFDYHAPGCEIEQCPECGGQLVSCDCASAPHAG